MVSFALMGSEVMLEVFGIFKGEEIDYKMEYWLDLLVNTIYRLTLKEPKHVPAGTGTGITRL